MRKYDDTVDLDARFPMLEIIENHSFAFYLIHGFDEGKEKKMQSH